VAGKPFLMRVLITGSRQWSDETAMADILGPWFSWDNVLVSGHNSRGADAMAEKLWAGWLDMTVADAVRKGYIDICPADWDGSCLPSCRKGHRKQNYGREYCPLAGHYRNAIMVGSDVGVCLAFACWCAIHPDTHYTHGTQDCAMRATAAGIPVKWTVQDAQGD
jgi:hypothetical protein